MSMNLGTDTGSMVNHIYSRMEGGPAPEVGMGATRLGWSDRHAMTIVKISPSGKTIFATRDTATRTDNNGMSECQAYEYTSNMDAKPYVFTRRKNGRFVEKGFDQNGPHLFIGERKEYYDFSY